MDQIAMEAPLTVDNWIAALAFFVSVVGALATFVWHARGLKGSVDRLDHTIENLAGTVNGLSGGVADNRERIVRLETLAEEFKPRA